MPAPRDSAGISDTLEGLRALPIDNIHLHMMSVLVTRTPGNRERVDFHLGVSLNTSQHHYFHVNL